MCREDSGKTSSHDMHPLCQGRPKHREVWHALGGPREAGWQTRGARHRLLGAQRRDYPGMRLGLLPPGSREPVLKPSVCGAHQRAQTGAPPWSPCPSSWNRAQCG